VLGVEEPLVIVRGAAFSIVEMYEASEPCSSVTECPQSDFPVEMTTYRVYQIMVTILQKIEDVPDGGRASRNPACEKSYQSSTLFFEDTPRGLWSILSEIKKE
jgi:hypothetical protein